METVATRRKMHASILTVRISKYFIYTLVLTLFLSGPFITLQRSLKYLFLSGENLSIFYRVGEEYQNSSDFDNFDNDTGSPDQIVPNIVHFLRFNQTQFRFIDAICILAAVKNQHPNLLFIHTDNTDFHGKYWEFLLSNPHFSSSYRLIKRDVPTTIFGQNLSKHFFLPHASDVARLRILMEYGGIYLDSDTYLVQNLDRFRHFELTLNWEDDDFLGSQTIVAHSKARFLREWLESYRDQYMDNLWYYNAGELPTTNILAKRPYLIHRVRGSFGVHKDLYKRIYHQYWPDWKKKAYSVHLLINHRSYLDEANFVRIPEFNEYNSLGYNMTIGDMIRDVLEWHHEQISK